MASTQNLRRLVLVLIAMTVLVASTVGSAGSSVAVGSVTVDGTWSCPVPPLNGYRAIKVDTTPALGIASASATIAGLLADPGSVIAGIEAAPNPGHTTGSISISRKCARVKRATALTRASLSGPDTFAASYSCDATKRVLVRLKATLSSKATWVKGQSFLAINRNVKAATLVVKSSTGRPIVYAQLLGKKARLWSDPIACTRR